MRTPKIFIHQEKSRPSVNGTLTSCGKCIMQLRGVRPFFSDKYDITKHPYYKYLSDFKKENTFDIEQYMKKRPAIAKPDTTIELYEVDTADLIEDTNNG